MVPENNTTARTLWILWLLSDILLILVAAEVVLSLLNIGIPQTLLAWLSLLALSVLTTASALVVCQSPTGLRLRAGAWSAVGLNMLIAIAATGRSATVIRESDALRGKMATPFFIYASTTENTFLLRECGAAGDGQWLSPNSIRGSIANKNIVFYANLRHILAGTSSRQRQCIVYSLTDEGNPMRYHLGLAVAWRAHRQLPFDNGWFSGHSMFMSNRLSPRSHSLDLAVRLSTDVRGTNAWRESEVLYFALKAAEKAESPLLRGEMPAR